MSATIVVTITCTLTDRRALLRAAHIEARAQGLSLAEARAVLRPERELDAGVCARWLLDPGISPPGLQIEDSCAEVSA